MTDPGGSRVRQLRTYPIQLTEVYCLDVSGERRPRTSDDPTEQALSVGLNSTPLSEDRLSFGCLLEVTATAPVLENTTAVVSVKVHGTFVAQEPTSDDVLADFVGTTPLVQLWPYARAHLGSIGTLLAIDLPILPLIDAFAPIEDDEGSDNSPG